MIELEFFVLSSLCFVWAGFGFGVGQSIERRNPVSALIMLVNALVWTPLLLLG